MPWIAGASHGGGSGGTAGVEPAAYQAADQAYK